MFDPVAVLPGDLAALCLSFVDVQWLLNVAQRVSRAWRKAIDGGLPAVWHYVSFDGTYVTEKKMALVTQTSHGHVLSFQAALAPQAFHHFHSLSNLRVLDIATRECVSPVLPCVPLLEELRVSVPGGIEFPSLIFLRTFTCYDCWPVKGIHNLPALTKLEMHGTYVGDGGAWPTSLRDVVLYNYHLTIYGERVGHPGVFDRVISLPHLTRLDTDWSFAHSSLVPFFTPPYDQLSCMARMTTLQHYAVRSENVGYASYHPHAICKHLGSVTSLRTLTLGNLDATDQDLHCLTQLTNLQHLIILYVNLSRQGFDHVCAVPNLTELHLGSCYSISDYSPVGRCSQLTTLQIRHAEHKLSRAEVLAITQLQHIRKLKLYTQLADPTLFSHFCTMRSLRDLDLWGVGTPIPAASFASLPSLSRLERIRVVPVNAMREMVDCLVQMPRLRVVDSMLRCMLSVQDEARLRDALPRLERD